VLLVLVVDLVRSPSLWSRDGVWLAGRGRHRWWVGWPVVAGGWLLIGGPVIGGLVIGGLVIGCLVIGNVVAGRIIG
jgi:hypothetical protein